MKTDLARSRAAHAMQAAGAVLFGVGLDACSAGGPSAPAEGVPAPSPVSGVQADPAPRSDTAGGGTGASTGSAPSLSGAPEPQDATSAPEQVGIYDRSRLKSDGAVDLSPPRGLAFDRTAGTPLSPPPPPGWLWYPVAGTSCRDGSGAGLFIRYGSAPRLLIYFEGGGACTSSGFCAFNPSNIDQVLSGTGETVLGTALGAVPGRQQPGAYQGGEVTGIFSADRAENPFRDWSIAYIPYCTGDVHFGTREHAQVPGVQAEQRFVGHLNARIFIGRLVATFAAGLEHVVVTGASAGSFGAGLNFSMVSDAFAGVQTDLIMDSGIPFDDAHWPVCLQRSWRELFGFDAALPPDCSQCFNADGGGLANVSDFVFEKHAAAHLALVSSLQDEVIRLFFTPGADDCAAIDSADPIQLTLGQLVGAPLFSAQEYEAALLGVRTRYASTGQLASYYLAGANVTLHQHGFRPRFFEPVAGERTLAQFTTDFLLGTMAQVGP
jgi:hypothetical protein